MNSIYGDGIHLDTAGIQQLLDSGTPLVELPVPEKEYLIDKPLRIHSGQELKLPRYCRIKLAAGSNCHMVINDDFENGNQNITLTGGIWDYNNLEQDKNPQYVKIIEKTIPPRKGTDVTVMRFKNVKNIHISGLTVKDPVTYAIWLDMASYFTVENIVFDFNLGNPRPANMDGVHVDGNSSYGTIRNIKGKCYDDLVALNADEGSDGDISHIDIDGLYAEDCHSAVRLLTSPAGEYSSARDRMLAGVRLKGITASPNTPKTFAISSVLLRTGIPTASIFSTSHPTMVRMRSRS